MSNRGKLYRRYYFFTHIGHGLRPNLEVLYIDGSDDFLEFGRNFESHVDERVDGGAQEVFYLLQHCKENARKLTEGCTGMRPQRGYDEARRLLFEQYGQSYPPVRA